MNQERHTDLRTRRITIRLTDDEMNGLLHTLNTRAWTLSEMIRQMIRQSTINSTRDTNDDNPKPHHQS